ncbi:MAG: bifunctional riboflavin kinase/FAD synthetase [Microcystaceae cyanobacterium]
MQITKSTTNLLTPTAIALGNFDGLHLGHQEVLRPILTTPNTSIDPTVVTFDPHPQEYFSGESRQLLTPFAEKADILDQLGIKQWVLLPFNQNLATLSPEQFFQAILVAQLQAKQISVGQDFCFGYQRKGDTRKLEELGQLFGVDVHITPLKLEKGSVRISSSLIRQALAKGDLTQANQMLGRNYRLLGKVVKGQQLGRKIGFPTANLDIAKDKLLPRYGVYGARVKVENDTNIMLGAVNIGQRPTVNGLFPTVEVHILDWQGDLYEQKLTVSLDRFIRPEQKFSGIEALKEQIKEDCDRIRRTQSACHPQILSASL